MSLFCDCSVQQYLLAVFRNRRDNATAQPAVTSAGLPRPWTGLELFDAWETRHERRGCAKEPPFLFRIVARQRARLLALQAIKEHGPRVLVVGGCVGKWVRWEGEGYLHWQCF